MSTIPSPGANGAPSFVPGAPLHGKGTATRERHHGHAHGGMATFIMDVDEIMAFCAPRVSRGLSPITGYVARQGARTANWMFGAGTCTAAQASRAGAAMAAGGGLLTVGGGIYYACRAYADAKEGLREADEETRAWQRAIGGQPQPAKADRAAGTGLQAKLARQANLSRPLRERLQALAAHRLSQSRLASVGKAAASVGAAAMAATLVFSPEFVLAPLVPALAPLSTLAMGVAIPAMAAYGVLSAWRAAKELLRGVPMARALRQMGDATSAEDDATDAQVRAIGAPHRARFEAGLACQLALGTGGLMLAAGLFLQMTSGPLGLVLLAIGTFALEGFSFWSDCLLGKFSAATLDAEPNEDALLHQSPAILRQKMDEALRLEAALSAQRVTRVKFARDLWLKCSGQASASALRDRLQKTLHALYPSQKQQTPDLSGPAKEAAVLNCLRDLELMEAFQERYTWEALPGNEAERRAFWRAALETLWSEGAAQAAERYTQARQLYFEHCVAAA